MLARILFRIESIFNTKQYACFCFNEIKRCVPLKGRHRNNLVFLVINQLVKLKIKTISWTATWFCTRLRTADLPTQPWELPVYRIFTEGDFKWCEDHILTLCNHQQIIRTPAESKRKQEEKHRRAKVRRNEIEKARTQRISELMGKVEEVRSWKDGLIITKRDLLQSSQSVSCR